MSYSFALPMQQLGLYSPSHAKKNQSPIKPNSKLPAWSVSQEPMAHLQPNHFSSYLVPVKKRSAIHFQGGAKAQVQLPVISLGTLKNGSKSEKAKLLDQLTQSLSQYGFVAISDHSVDPWLVQDYYKAMQGVFALPIEEKKQYVRADLGRSRGYYELGQEMKAAVLGSKNKFADKKENWHSGASDTLNVFPKTSPTFTPEQNEAIEQFQKLNLELYDQMEEASFTLAEAIGQCLDKLGLEDKGYLKSLLKEGDNPIAASLMRSIHYPPVPEAERQVYEPGVPVIRAGDHRDMNLFTILPEATEAGLEIQPLSNVMAKAGGKLGDWLPIHSQQGNLIVNVGDMLSLITGGKIDEKGQITEHGAIPSIRHRVVGDSKTLDKPRYSIPFFVHPHDDEPLINLKTKETVLKAADFKHRRLSAHGSLNNKSVEAFRKDSEPLLRKHQ